MGVASFVLIIQNDGRGTKFENLCSEEKGKKLTKRSVCEYSDMASKSIKLKPVSINETVLSDLAR